MKAPLLEFPCYQYQISDWKVKKKMLIDRISKQIFIRSDYITPAGVGYNINLETDRPNGKSYVRYLQDILTPELSQFSKEVGDNFYIESAWCGRYVKGDCQNIHNHRSWGFSAVLYLVFDPKIHAPTLFVSPWQNPIDDTTHVGSPQNVTEGTVFIFPSCCLHYVTPSKASQPRIIVAFDLLPEHQLLNKNV